MNPLDQISFFQIFMTAIGGLALYFVLRSACKVALVNRPDDDRISLAATRLSFWIINLPLVWGKHSPAKAHRFRSWLPAIYVGILISFYFSGSTLSFACLYWGWGAVDSFWKAVIASGSALSTLGFATPENFPGNILSILEGALGLGIVVFLLTFVPGYQSALTLREEKIAWLYCRLGECPDGARVVAWISRQPGQREAFWEDWEQWFRTNLRSHAQAPFLLLTPSFRFGFHWTTGVSAVLDAATFFVSCQAASISPNDPSHPQTDPAPIPQSSADIALAERICLEEGIEMMQFFCRLPKWESRLQPQVPDRDKFDAMWQTALANNLPLPADCDLVWHAYSAWNKKYSNGIALFESELRVR